MNNKEIVAILPVCSTCGWKGKKYYLSIEGSLECAKVSAIIETRLDHLLKTEGDHNINYIEVSKE